MAAGLGFKTFTTGEVLSASDVNGYLMQGINVFANTTARDAAITSPQEGQFAYTKDTNSLWYYTGSAWAASGAAGDIEGVTAGVGISGGGTSGTVTITNSMATAIDAKGDLVAGTGADAFSRLAVGSNDTVLTADSTTATGLKWATVAGGGMTVIASGTLSGSSITISSIPQTYRNLQLVMRNTLMGTGNAPSIRFNGDTGTNYYNTSTTAVNLVTWNSTWVRPSSSADTTTSQGFIITNINDYTNTSTWKTVASQSINNRATDPTKFDIAAIWSYWYANNGSSAITDIELRTDTSGFTSGTYTLYGVK